MDKKTIARDSTTVLDWLGDVGGLYSALYVIGWFCLGWIGDQRMTAVLTNRLFKDDSAFNSKNLNKPVEGQSQ